MAQVTRLGLYGGPRPPQTFTAAITAALTGTLIDATATEADIRAGGLTIIIKLTGRVFKAADTGPIGSEADSLVLLSGMNSAQSELLGWNNEVRDKEVTTAIVRDSDTQATITLTASPLYDITANENITVIVPADVMTEGLALVATPTFDITFIAATGRRGGGIGGRHRRGKRRLILNGRVYEVKSLREEQGLIENYLRERKEEVVEMPPAEQRAARISINKAERRLASVKKRSESLKKRNQRALLLFAAANR